MRRYLIITAIVICFGAAGSAAAADYVPLAPIPGLTETVDPTNTSNIATFFNAIYVFLIGIAVVLAVIMIIWGGFQYALAEAITSKSEGKRKIQQALFCLVLVLSPALVFAIINPAILNLSVNLQPLHTTWGNKTSTAVPEQTVADKNPSNVLASGGHYKTCTSKSECDSIYDTCRVPALSGWGVHSGIITCLKSDKTTGPRLDWSINRWSDYECPTDQKLVVVCPTGSEFQ